MKRLSIVFLFFSVLVNAQVELQAKFQKSQDLKADRFVGVDNFNSVYYLDNNALIKQTPTSDISFSNFQLGEIHTADVFNPLKINLFYSDFNTLIVLDNRMTEITKVDFNQLSPFRVISLLSTGNDNTVWIYNQNTQQLELFDYKSRKTRTTTLPIAGNALDLSSNYNFCFLLTESHILVYNYTGSLFEKLKNPGFSALQASGEKLFFLMKNSLYYKFENSPEIKALILPELLIKQFFVTDETLYIYDGNSLHQFQLNQI